MTRNQEGKMADLTREQLVLIAEGLTALLREEWGEKMPTSEIAGTWTPLGLTKEHIEALRAWDEAVGVSEPQLPENAIYIGKGDDVKITNPTIVGTSDNPAGVEE
jgi:hypothetical protein